MLLKLQTILLFTTILEGYVCTVDLVILLQSMAPLAAMALLAPFLQVQILVSVCLVYYTEFCAGLGRKAMYKEYLCIIHLESWSSFMLTAGSFTFFFNPLKILILAH